MSPQILFIVGGTGYIGGTVIEYAVKEGYHVRSLSRTESSDSKLHALGATPVRGSLTTLDTLTREASFADVVINTADAISSDYGIDPTERFRINNAAIDALAQGLKGSGKPLVVVSGSAGTQANPDGHETNEASPLWADSPFGEGVEKNAFEKQDLGVRVCAVRLPPWVFGRGGSGVRLFMQQAANARGWQYVDEGSARTTTVHVDDAARLFLLVAKNGKSGEAYNAAWETNVTHRQLAEAMARALQVPLRQVAFDDFKKAAGEFFAMFLSLENRASNAKAKEELGWEIQAEKGILEDIASGSYVSVVEDLRKSMA